MVFYKTLEGEKIFFFYEMFKMKGEGGIHKIFHRKCNFCIPLNGSIVVGSINQDLNSRLISISQTSSIGIRSDTIVAISEWRRVRTVGVGRCESGGQKRRTVRQNRAQNTSGCRDGEGQDGGEQEL